MRNLHRYLLLGLALCLLPGCNSAKKYQDYCNKCLDTYTEDGCKAFAKAELKAAKVLNCVKEFKDMADCLDGASCESATACASEYEKYDSCTCNASEKDATYCD